MYYNRCPLELYSRIIKKMSTAIDYWCLTIIPHYLRGGPGSQKQLQTIDHKRELAKGMCTHACCFFALRN